MITKEFILIGLAIAADNGKVIDCSIAEISPDYTNAMKEACRKARMAQ
jgi:hypothetical protein